MKTLSDLYLEARKTLSLKEEQDTASLLARNLLCHITNKTPEAVIADRQQIATEEQSAKMDVAVARLLAGEPLAYVLGEWEFFGITLSVDKNVLIPRDDTCAVTELAIEQGLKSGKAPRILDLCTGSGCIGLAIATKIPDARVTLADASREAIAVAKKNIQALHLTGRVSCLYADALKAPERFLGSFEVIVSNPPYITSAEMEELPRSVKDFEPEMALHGGDDGLKFYRAIAENYKAALKPGGCLCFEFGMGQGDAVCQILEENGYTILDRTKDYNRIERAVIAQYGRKER